MSEREQPNRRVEAIGLLVGLVFILGVASFSFWKPWERDLGALVSFVVLKLLLLVALIGLGAVIRECVVIVRLSRRRRPAAADADDDPKVHRRT